MPDQPLGEDREDGEEGGGPGRTASKMWAEPQRTPPHNSCIRGCSVTAVLNTVDVVPKKFAPLSSTNGSCGKRNGRYQN